MLQVAKIECTVEPFDSRIRHQEVRSRVEGMKRAAIVIAVLGAGLEMCVWSFGQSNDKAAAQNPPAGQAAQPAGQAAAPGGKRPPKVNSQEEFAAYKAAAALAEAPALEKAS